ncbi:MAG: S1C family serine protease [Firmicutes bacterium]|nr:S1C family serine protease [Bacillota bacterium]
MKNHFSKIKIILLACILAIIPFLVACTCLENDGNIYIIREPSTQEQVFNKFAPSVVAITVGTQVGTGFLYYNNENDLYFVTNYHVVAEHIQNRYIAILLEFQFCPSATTIETSQILSRLEHYTAELVGYDYYFDIAVIRIPHFGIFLENYYRHSINDIATYISHATPLLAIGNMDGAGISAFGGLMSNPNRIIDFGVNVAPHLRFRPVQQVSVNLNRGTSGGPILDMYGKLVGISSFQQYSDSEGRPLIGVSFSVASSVAKPLIDRAILLNTGGRIPKIASYMESLNTLILSGLGRIRVNITSDGQLIVVDNGTRPSGATGEWLQVGDRIVAIGEHSIGSNYRIWNGNDFFARLNAYAHQSFYTTAGVNLNELEQLRIIFLRNGTQHTLSFLQFLR